jgi:hypothetical protein
MLLLKVLEFRLTLSLIRTLGKIVKDGQFEITDNDFEAATK